MGSSTETSLTLTKAMAQKVLANAQAVYEEALNLLGDAFSLVVPNVEWQFMKRQADQHSEEALRIKEVADQLMVEHSQVLEEATFQSESASELLAKGIRQQQMTDELLVDADSALAKAKDAVLLGDKTLEEAQKTLEGFDSTVQESKDKAVEALGQFGDIENLIAEAEGRTQEAKVALSGAEVDAVGARDAAILAKERAEQASEFNIRDGASDTRNRAGILKDTAESPTTTVADKANRLRTLETDAMEDQALAKEAMEKANQAKSISSDSSMKVRETVASANEILTVLNNMGSIDTAALDELESKLAAAERDFAESDLERRIEEMRQ